MLCSACSAIFVVDSPERTLTLTASARYTTCELCVLLSHRFLLSSETTQPSHGLPLREDKASSQCTIQCALEIDHLQLSEPCVMSFSTAHSTSGPPSSLNLTLLPEFDTLYTKGIASAPLGDNYSRRLIEIPNVVDTTDSMPSYIRASTWVRDCVRDHIGCRKLDPGPRRLPRRLIHVGPTAENLRPCLQETSSLPADLSYATLSHCWGSAPICCLVTNNYHEFLHQLPVDKLPKVFTDAITVTGRAGFDYLWIDSLCIIQDSAEDWAAESRIMGSVYENGVLNLAATGFKEGSRGMFVQRPVALFRPIEVYVKGNMRERKHIVLQEGKHFLVDGGMWIAGVDDAPLSQRAWFLQERMLSPRTLHFGSNQLFWECSELAACELFPRGFPSVVSCNNLKSCVRSTERPANSPVTISSHWAHQTGWTAWFIVVREYSRGRLTIPSDKLVAVSGLARLMQPRMECRYLAGLWEENLLHQLLWLSPDSERREAEGVTPTLAYISPSWSWASVDSLVEATDESRAACMFSTVRLDTFSLILDADVTLLDDNDDFGRVTDGFIRIRGPLGIIMLKSGAENPDTEMAMSSPLPGISINLDGFLPAGHKQHKRNPGFLGIHQLDPRMAIDLSSETVFFYLTIRTQFTVETDEPELAGLILRPTGKSKGQFSRRGMFVTDKPDEMTLLMKSTMGIPPAFYEELNPDGDYTICIV
jgi:Heterokaryon incompatibility protein (HET)